MPKGIYPCAMAKQMKKKVLHLDGNKLYRFHHQHCYAKRNIRELKKITYCRCTIQDTDTELKKLKADLIIFK